jgi:hypothetical protein
LNRNQLNSNKRGIEAKDQYHNSDDTLAVKYREGDI